MCALGGENMDTIMCCLSTEMVLVLSSAHIKKFSVSCMQEFFVVVVNIHFEKKTSLQSLPSLVTSRNPCNLARRKISVVFFLFLFIYDNFYQRKLLLVLQIEDYFVYNTSLRFTTFQNPGLGPWAFPSNTQNSCRMTNLNLQ